MSGTISGEACGGMAARKGAIDPSRTVAIRSTWPSLLHRVSGLGARSVPARLTSTRPGASPLTDPAAKLDELSRVGPTCPDRQGRGVRLWCSCWPSTSSAVCGCMALEFLPWSPSTQDDRRQHACRRSRSHCPARSFSSALSDMMHVHERGTSRHRYPHPGNGRCRFVRGPACACGPHRRGDPSDDRRQGPHRQVRLHPHGAGRLQRGAWAVATRVERHFMDTIEGGKWLPNQDMAWKPVRARLSCACASWRTRSVASSTATPTASLHQKAFAGQTADRTVHKGDLTGIEIINRLMEQVLARRPREAPGAPRRGARPDPRRSERWPACSSSTCARAPCASCEPEAVLMATGGGPTMYKYHTPSGDKTMDGLAMALRAGLTLARHGNGAIPSDRAARRRTTPR